MDARATSTSGSLGLSEPALVLVDDDEAVRAALAFSMEMEGYAVSTFATAEDVLAHPPKPAPSYCYVIDQKLPGMDGLSLAAHLREKDRLAPVVLITSNPSLMLRARASAAKVEIVEKPLIGDVLVYAVKRAIGF